MEGVLGVVLAGVHHWDAGAFDRLLPRPLMPVAHAPLICHVLAWMRDAGVVRVTVCANASSRLVRRALGDGTWLHVDLHYYEDWTPRGPAGCVRDAGLDAACDRLVVSEATILPDVDLQALLEAHARSGAAVTVVAARERERPNGGEPSLTPAGVYVFERDALLHVGETGYQDIKEVLIPWLYERGVPVCVHAQPAPCPRVADVASYLAINGLAVERLTERPAAMGGYERVNGGFVHHSAQVSSPERLIGPVLIGPETVVAADVTIVGPATIGAECVIDSSAVVCGSVLWDGCHVGREAVIDQSVLSQGVWVAPGRSVAQVAAGWPKRRRPNGQCERPGAA